LFGFDVIGDLKKLDFYIIDINHFPGYKNVAKIKELFDDLFL
jgi:inositol-1,3,4-trisphosphate 5/6-kinase/inositol-tetrakisphosphate 1-kinase